jgi:hypothetical protein
MKPLAPAAVLLLATFGSNARGAAPDAEPKGADKPSWEAAPAKRRSGFTAGVLTGMSFGSVEGYPNDFSKIDVASYRSATSGVGTSTTLYLGGTLTDWFTFAFGISPSSYGSSQLVTKSSAFLFHIEAFPFFARGNVFRDIALFADFGTGTATIRRRTDGAEFSASGSLSIVGLGALWETWRLAGHLAFGPYTAAHYENSNSMTRYFGELGLRGTFYGGP